MKQPWTAILGQTVPTPSGSVSWTVLGFLGVTVCSLIAAILSGKFVVPASQYLEVKAERDDYKARLFEVLDSMTHDTQPQLRAATNVQADAMTMLMKLAEMLPPPVDTEQEDGPSTRPRRRGVT